MGKVHTGEALAMIGKNLISAPGAAEGLVLDFLLPLRCLCCETKVASEDGLCPRCWQNMHFIEKPWCHRLGIPFTYDVGEGAWSPRAIASPPVFDRLRSVAFYDGPARELVLALKFSRRRELARSMGRWMSRSGSEFLSRDSLVIPVPLHWLRLLSRRFNQSADLAKAVAGHCGGQFEPELLKRRKRTRQQVGLSAKDRLKNVRSAFAIDTARMGEVQGRHVVLIDDVMTTGSTVSACSKVLLASGAASVNVLTFALADPSIRSGDGSLSV
ncbi:ComF family protein [Roseibium marinum]|uniref:ComF family protein n=1 Tax=Roseibium marinum TaxID=281252 RepID=A0A2S3USH2_9HYPH|nr:ComF family protein [Roseibium marinum]POF30419.1 ComF family protein [Roseibium marinum]